MAVKWWLLLLLYEFAKNQTGCLRIRWSTPVLCFLVALATHTHTHAHTHTQPFNGLLSGTARVARYQKKHSPTHTHPDHRTLFINFLHLQRSMASSLFSLCTWQSSRTTSIQVLFGLPLGLGPSTSYFMHFFTQSSSSFRSTCPYQRSLFCCNINAMSSTPSQFLQAGCPSCRPTNSVKAPQNSH